MGAQFRDALEAALGRFPFGEVAGHMKEHRWTWGERRTPTHEEMRDCCRELLSGAVRFGSRNSSGGFEVLVGSDRVEVAFQGKGYRIKTPGGPKKWTTKRGPRWESCQRFVERETAWKVEEG